MKIIVFSWRYLWSRPLSAALNLLLLSLGLASITFLLLVSHQISSAFDRDLAGIDVVVGAKGSLMQLILSGVFQLDVPTGNIPLAAVKALLAHPQVAKVIPISMDDSFRGFRIVGTMPDYPGYYHASLAKSVMWTAPMQAVLGARVALQSGLKVGDTFTGTHGLVSDGHEHGHNGNYTRQCTSPKIPRRAAHGRTSTGATLGAGYAPARLQCRVPTPIASGRSSRHG